MSLCQAGLNHAAGLGLMGMSPARVAGHGVAEHSVLLPVTPFTCHSLEPPAPGKAHFSAWLMYTVSIAGTKPLGYADETVLFLLPPFLSPTVLPAPTKTPFGPIPAADVDLGAQGCCSPCSLRWISREPGSFQQCRGSRTQCIPERRAGWMEMG